MRSMPRHSPPAHHSSDSDKELDALDRLLGEFAEWKRAKQGERMGKYRPKAPEPAVEASSDGPEGEEMPQECRDGTCDHPEHRMDDLDALLD